MVTFKGGWGKLYYTQHTFLSNVRQLPFFLEIHTHTHTQGRWKEILTQRHTTTPLKNHGNFYGRVRQVILYTTHSFKQCGTITFFFRNKHTHTHKGEENGL